MILDVDWVLITPLISYNLFIRNIALSLQFRMATLSIFQRNIPKKYNNGISIKLTFEMNQRKNKRNYQYLGVISNYFGAIAK